MRVILNEVENCVISRHHYLSHFFISFAITSLSYSMLPQVILVLLLFDATKGSLSRGFLVEPADRLLNDCMFALYATNASDHAWVLLSASSLMAKNTITGLSQDTRYRIILKCASNVEVEGEEYKEFHTGHCNDQNVILGTFLLKEREMEREERISKAPWITSLIIVLSCIAAINYTLCLWENKETEQAERGWEREDLAHSEVLYSSNDT